MRIRQLIFLAALLMVACGKSNAAPPSHQANHVTVSDMEHRVILKLSTPSQLELFNTHWSAKKDTRKANSMKLSEFQVFIDVRAPNGGGRWPYSTGGQATKLNHMAHPLYRITSPIEFNRIIGLKG